MYRDRIGGSLSEPHPPNRASLDDDEPGKRHGPGFWAGLIILGVAVAGLCWYGYPFLLKQKSLLHEFPALQQAFTNLGERMSRTEADLHRWYGEQEDLRDRLGKLQSGVDAKFKSARKEAQELAEQTHRRVSREMDRQEEGVNRRLARVESSQQSEQAKVTGLESQLGEMKREVDRQATRLAALDQNGSAEREAVQQRLSGLDQRVDGNKSELSRFIRSTETRRIDFELSKNHSHQLAPGISVCVTGTDVAFRRLKGWMWIMPDRKTIWLRDQAALQPVVFYSQVDGKRRELVFTSVGKNSAVGYLLLPSGAESARTTAARTERPPG
jgi:chaperonin cofactor prefoldin